MQRNDKNSLMLQIKNVSSEVQYDQEKSHSDLLMMINATVSHELRNPLNSLIAQNIEKKALYKEVIKVVLQSKIDDVSKEEFKKVMEKLNQGLNVQESSANLMEFLVQDLLDYAQLKAGKFRKNIAKFNI